MKIATFNKLKKLMMLTFSESDNEALSSMRAANRILRDHDIDWDRVFARTVTVVNEFEEAPAEESPDQAKAREAAEIEEAFSTVEASDPKGSFADFIASLRDQWDARRRLSPAQKDALFKAARKR